MQDITELPETARIRVSETCPVLRIENHRVQNGFGGFTGWILGVVKFYNWTHILSRIKSQRISYRAFADTCAVELEDIQKIKEVIFWNFCTTEGYGTRVKYASSVAARKIAVQLSKKISNCKNWGEFHDKVRPDSDFGKKMQQKIEYGMKKCRK